MGVGMEAGSLTVMLVEDEPEFRALVAAVLGRGPFRVKAPDLEGWPEDVEGARPDVLLLDLALPGGVPAMEQIPRIVAACPTTMVGALTGSPAEELEDSALRAGAFVFYEKEMLDELSSFIVEDLALFRQALSGEEIVAPSALTRRRTSAPTRRPQSAER